jgi:hypothetical protein
VTYFLKRGEESNFLDSLGLPQTAVYFDVFDPDRYSISTELLEDVMITKDTRCDPKLLIQNPGVTRNTDTHRAPTRTYISHACPERNRKRGMPRYCTPVDPLNCSKSEKYVEKGCDIRKAC